MIDSVKVVVLAGGKGTRLRGVIRDIPKPMAPVGEKPFLEYIILQIRKWGIKEIIMSVGHKKETIKDYFNDGKRWGVEIEYCEEDNPLGTGGALRKAIFSSKGKSYVVMNGDSFLDINMGRLLRYHEEKKAMFTIGLVQVEDTGRFGRVLVNKNGSILEFMEKGYRDHGIINGGIYVCERDVIDIFPQERCSLENDVLPKLVGNGLYGMKTKGYFIDIGVPEEYGYLLNNPKQLIRRVEL